MHTEKNYSGGFKSISCVSFPSFMFLGMALAFFFGGLAETRATITPYKVDASNFSQFALLSNGQFNVNQSQINGNTGVVGGATNGANNDTFNGNFSYSNSPLTLNSSVNVTGVKAQSFTLASTISSAASFSQTIAKFTATRVLPGDVSGNTLLSGNGGVNVIDVRGNNLNGTVTLSGGANDVFYINVHGNMSLQGVTLSGGVTANNVFWNILGGNANLGGTLNGTLLAFNGGGQTSSLNINNATVNGGVIAGNLNMNNVAINAIPPSVPDSAAMAPEVNSKVVLGLFVSFLLGSAALRFWKSRSPGFCPG